MNKSTLLFNQPIDKEFNTSIRIPRFLLPKFNEEFLPWCEIEVLSGERIEHEDDDTVEFKFNLDDEKKSQFREMLVAGFNQNFDNIKDN